MSLFVGIRPEEAAADDLQHLIHRFRGLPVTSGMRWQPAGLWHATVAFLGDPGEDVVAEVRERLEGFGAGRAPVDGLRLTGSGCFDGQVVWMGLGDDEAVAGLAAQGVAIRSLLRGSGVVADYRRWRPHLTVGRARNGSGRPVADLLAGYEGPPWTADELLLIRSTGGPQPTHHVVQTIPLTGGTPGPP